MHNRVRSHFIAFLLVLEPMNTPSRLPVLRVTRAAHEASTSTIASCAPGTPNESTTLNVKPSDGRPTYLDRRDSGFWDSVNRAMKNPLCPRGNSTSPIQAFLNVTPRRPSRQTKILMVEPMPSQYWAGRYMAVSDRLRNRATTEALRNNGREDLDQMRVALANEDLDGTREAEENSVYEILDPLYGECGTADVRASLDVSQLPLQTVKPNVLTAC